MLDRLATTSSRQSRLDAELRAAATEICQGYIAERLAAPPRQPGAVALWWTFVALFVLWLLLVPLVVVFTQFHLDRAAVGVAWTFVGIFAVYVLAILGDLIWSMRPGAVKRILNEWIDFNDRECGADQHLMKNLAPLSKGQIEEIELWLARRADDLGWRMGAAWKPVWLVTSVVFAGLAGTAALRALVHLSTFQLADAVVAVAGVALVVTTALRWLRAPLTDALAVTRLVLKRKTESERRYFRSSGRTRRSAHAAPSANDSPTG